MEPHDSSSARHDRHDRQEIGKKARLRSRPLEAARGKLHDGERRLLLLLCCCVERCCCCVWEMVSAQLAAACAETWQAMGAPPRASRATSALATSTRRRCVICCRTPRRRPQVELHPHLQQEKLLRFCRENDFAVTGFSPLGAAGYVEIGMVTPADSALNDPAVGPLADRPAVGRAARHQPRSKVTLACAARAEPRPGRLRAVGGGDGDNGEPRPAPPLQRPRRLLPDLRLNRAWTEPRHSSPCRRRRGPSECRPCRGSVHAGSVRSTTEW